MQALTRIFPYLQMALWAVMLWASVFSVDFSLFNGLVHAKQRVVEIFIPCLFVFVPLVYFLKSHWRITIVDVLVFILAAYLLVWEVLVVKSPYVSYFNSSFPVFLWLVLYWCIRTMPAGNILIWFVLISWLLVVIAQAVLGLMQLYDFLPSNHALFKISGSFHNPGPYSGFIATGLPLALVLLIQPFRVHSESVVDSKRMHLAGVGLQALAWLTIISVALVLPAAQSRAAWLAGAVGLIFVLLRTPVAPPYRERLVALWRSMSRLWRLASVVLFLVLMVAVVYGLYSYKKGSADGRWLIWRVTAELVKDKPLIGYGAGGFKANYMDAQAAWFASGKGSATDAMVAGSPETPFNELLKVSMERGVLALMVVLCLIWLVLKKRFPIYPLSGLQGALLCLLVFGLFSYPFDQAPLLVLLASFVAVLAGYSKPIFNVPVPTSRWLAVPLFLLFAAFTAYSYPFRKDFYQALRVWQEADAFYSMHAFEVAIEAYEEAYPVLASDGLFLQMYGKSLSMIGAYEKSNAILERTQACYGGIILQNTLGHNYDQLGEFSKAVAAYQKSRLMVPSALFSRYSLAKLYYKHGHYDLAREVANGILNSDVKIPSSATRDIMIEMNEIMKETSDVQTQFQ